MSAGGASYRDAGVDYEALDSAKRLAMLGALSTSSLLGARGGRALDASRGEPAFVFELGGRSLALVLEGLGTKSVIARAVLEQQGIDRFGDVAYDTVAAILNDLVCVGALPLVVNAYFATGDSRWYEQRGRSTALLEGWRRGCEDAGCVWGGGESPTLPGMLSEQDIELAGAAVGALPEGVSPILGADLVAGDEIVLVRSSGLHANGASLARLLAERLPEGFATPLPAGGSFGEALLDPTVMYVGLVAELLRQRIGVRYLSHVTGHGLLKLMRPSASFTYRITGLPDVPPVLAFIVSEAGMDAAEAYSTLNMGAGFAVYCARGQADAVLAAAAGLGLDAMLAGRVEEGPRRVVLEPLGVSYDGSQLELSVERS
ncbi:MAG TPA: AIR synthase-related protein [Solirubrobacteraceae bacterium]|nr:AIR synthase-related protein [Solirubrobacteraceae bacterium]